MTNYHFVGIKGSGMSALAQILHDMNFQVQGSDVEKRFFTQVALRAIRDKDPSFSKGKYSARNDDYCRKCFSRYA